MERCVECSKEQTCNQCLTLFNDVAHISTQRRGRIPGKRTQVGWETTCLNTHRISKFLKREMDTGYNYQLLSSMVKRGLHVCPVRGPSVESGTFTIPTTGTIFAQRPHACSRGHGSEAIKQRAVYLLLHYTIVIVNSI